MPNNESRVEKFIEKLKRIERQCGDGSSGRISGPMAATKRRRMKRPPDEASYAVGRGVALSISDQTLETSSLISLKEVQEEIFTVLANGDINPAVCQGFFDTLLEPVEGEFHNDSDLDDFLTACILFTDRNDFREEKELLNDDADDDHDKFLGPLTCMIRAYACFVGSKCIRDLLLKDTSPSSYCLGSIPITYSKLQTQAGRLAMLRGLTEVAFSRQKQQHVLSSNICSRQIYNHILNPLLACSVISSPNNTLDSLSMIESILCMEGIWRQVDLLIEDSPTAEDEDCTHVSLVFNTIDWLTDMLDLFLLSIASPMAKQRIIGKDLAYRWFTYVLDVGLFVARSVEIEKHKQQRQKLIDWFEGVLSRTLLLWFSAASSFRIRIGSFWTPIKELMEIYASQRALSLESTLKISTIALCHPIKQDVKEILCVMAIALGTPHELHSIAISIMKGLGSIFFRDTLCSASAKCLLKILTETKLKSNAMIASQQSGPLRNLVQVFEHERSIDPIISYFVSCEHDLFDTDHVLSPFQQAGSLMLFGVGLLDKSHVGQQQAVHVFLGKLLRVYPHLGISLLPVLVDSINSCVVRGDGDCMLGRIEFLAEIVVREAQCAREIWNLLGKEFMRENIPASIRSSIIRLFPMVCRANKRLYKRVIECMGNTLVNCNSDDRKMDDNFELRLAIAATTSELAQGNFIRDPADVISWLQDFITDTGWVRSISNPYQNARGTIAHYSILTLNSLVLAGELDFKLVLVVLGKKLCDVHDINEISRLPHLVLEALILLLGSSETEVEYCSEADDRRKSIGISRQTSRSVETLVNLWRSEHFGDPKRKATVFRCKNNILTSLTNYSFDALGVDEEGIRSTCTAAGSEITVERQFLVPSGARYNALKDIIKDGIGISNTMNICKANQLNNFQEVLHHEFPDDFYVSLVGFICKILKFEEVTFGSLLWQKRHSSSSREKVIKKSLKNQKPNLSEKLPCPNSILDSYNGKRNQATSLGALLSFDGETVPLLNDLVIDATRDLSDTMNQILYVQAWLNAGRNVLCTMMKTESVSESIEKLINQVKEFQLDNSDSALMFLSAIGTLIPEILAPRGDFSTYISDISKHIWDSYHANAFEYSNAAKLCLGLLGASMVCVGNLGMSLKIVKCLEKTTTGYGGLPSFGAYYSLAVIAQKCVINDNSKAIESHSDHDMAELKERIVIFILNELAKCTKGSQTAINILISLITERTLNPEDIDVLVALQKTSVKIKKSKINTSKYIFIALGICLPCFTSANEKLLSPLVCFLESIEWGSGVGFCLHPILRQWSQSNFNDTKGVEKRVDTYSKLFDEHVQNHNFCFLDEILYAMMAFPLKSDSRLIKKIRMVKREEGGEPVSLVLAVTSIASIPCLGNGADRFVTESPYIFEAVTDADVTDVVDFVSEVSINMAMIMRGFLASLRKFNGLDREIDVGIGVGSLIDELHGSKLPEAHLGTGLEIVMLNLHQNMKDHNVLSLVTLLKCLEVIALPNQFAFLIEVLLEGSYLVKGACIKLLVSQLKGRPRAIFDGRDFVKLALKICKMSINSIQKTLGEKGATEIFVDAFGEMITKFISQDVERVFKNMFQFCISQFDQNSALLVTFLLSVKRMLQHIGKSKSPRFSPKCLKSIYLFLQQSAFSGIHDATSSYSNGMPPKEMTKIVTVYTDCIALIPEIQWINNKILKTTEIDGFSGKALRVRLLMSLIRNHSQSFSSHLYQEVTASIAWMSQQLIECNERVFSPTFLQVVCMVAGVSSLETDERKNEIILSILDSFLIVDSNVGFVCLEILSAFAFQFCYGYGSNGDLSLLRVLGPSIDKWVDLPPEILEKAFALAVNDLSFNLARFARHANLSCFVFNRLSRVYTKWVGQGSDERTLTPLRMYLTCCRDNKTVANMKDLTMLVTSIVSKENCR